MALIGEEHFPKAFRKKLKYDYGTSVLSVYLGLKNIDLRRYGFGEQNLFWHPKVDLNEVYDDQLSERIPERPYFFCNAPTLRPHHAVLAPPGCDQLVMVAPCNYDFFRKLREQSEQDYQAAKQQYADNIIGVLRVGIHSQSCRSHCRTGDRQSADKPILRAGSERQLLQHSAGSQAREPAAVELPKPLPKSVLRRREQLSAGFCDHHPFRLHAVRES